MGIQVSDAIVAEHGIVNAVEEALLQQPQMPVYDVEHFVFPGFIARQVLLRANTVLTTERHKQWHPYVVSFGNVLVYNEAKDEVSHVTAVDVPDGHFTSLTEPGTRRLIVVLEDTLWTTFHPCTHGDPNRLVEEVIYPNDNPLIH